MTFRLICPEAHFHLTIRCKVLKRPNFVYSFTKDLFIQPTQVQTIYQLISKENSDRSVCISNLCDRVLSALQQSCTSCEIIGVTEVRLVVGGSWVKGDVVAKWKGLKGRGGMARKKSLVRIRFSIKARTDVGADRMLKRIFV